jgi:hypothetical protein
LDPFPKFPLFPYQGKIQGNAFISVILLGGWRKFAWKFSLLGANMMLFGNREIFCTEQGIGGQKQGIWPEKALGKKRFARTTYALPSSPFEALGSK